MYATKGVDLDSVSWIIQCKCCSPKRKVGPAIVRELVGTLQQYPAGTRGMIVTTNGFSPEAMHLAAESGVRLMDGVEFRQMIAKARKTESGVVSDSRRTQTEP